MYDLLLKVLNRRLKNELLWVLCHFTLVTPIREAYSNVGIDVLKTLHSKTEKSKQNLLTEYFDCLKFYTT